MITNGQYDALGPLGREIIDHDRGTAADADMIAATAVVPIGWGRHIRERRSERARLTAAAAVICKGSTDTGKGGPPRTAAMGRR